MSHRFSKVGIVGFGSLTGLSLYKFLQADEIYIFDQSQSLEQKEWIETYQKKNQKTFFNKDEVSFLPKDLELLLISPGIDFHHPLLEKARLLNIRIQSEIDFAYEQIQAPILAVTGSMGKSTMVKLLFDLLSQKYKNVFLGGNYGIPLIDAVGKPWDWVVVEVSSFQLEASASFHPKIAVWLNFHENHLDRHKSQLKYHQAKAKIFQNHTNEDVAIINFDDESMMKLDLSSTIKTFSSVSNQADAFLSNTELICKSFSMSNKVDSIPLQQKLVSMIVAEIEEINQSDLLKVWNRFEPLPYRLQRVLKTDAITWINDSKSTTVDSTLFAIEQIQDPIHLIIGGRNKNMALEKFTTQLQHNSKLKSILVFGEVSTILKPRLESNQCYFFKTLDEVILHLGKELDFQRSQTVLFSPGFASFDQYKGMADRGNHFNQLIQKHFEIK